MGGLLPTSFMKAASLPALPAVGFVLACSGSPAIELPAGATSESVVYDADDRVEAYDVEPSVAASMVALIDASALGDADDLPPWERVWSTLSLEARAGVCDDTRFADQPAPVACTGALVGSDLVLTAGHCARNLACE